MRKQKDEGKQVPIFGKAIVGRGTRALPCKLTQEDLNVRSKSLAHRVRELEDHETHAAAVKAGLKSEGSVIEEQIKELARVIDRGEELRIVEVVNEAEFATGTVFVVRSDTGEKIETRAITTAERQTEIPDGRGGSLRRAPVEDEAADQE